MKYRCYNLKDKSYKNYGGRGIKVCDRWVDSPDNFYQDMAPTWKPGLELDRINNNDDYSPENCKWSTKSEQALNRRPQGKIPYKGISFDKKSNKYYAQICIGRVPKFIGRFDTILKRLMKHIKNAS